MPVRAFRPSLPPHAFLHYKDLEWVCSNSDGLCDYIDKNSRYTVKELVLNYPSYLRYAIKDVEIIGPYREEWGRLQKGIPLLMREKWLVPRRGDCILPEACRAGPDAFLLPERLQYQRLRMCYAFTQRCRKTFGEMPWEYNAAKRVVFRPLVRPVDILEKVLADLPDPLTIASCTAAHSSYRSLQPLASLVYWARNKAMAFVDNMLRGRPPVVLRHKNYHVSSNARMTSLN